MGGGGANTSKNRERRRRRSYNSRVEDDVFGVAIVRGDWDVAEPAASVNHVVLSSSFKRTEEVIPNLLQSTIDH
jgi:hypothetical protein